MTEMQKCLLGLGMLTSMLSQIRGSEISWMISSSSSSASCSFAKSVSVILAASVDILWCTSFSFTKRLMWNLFICLIKLEDTPFMLLIILPSWQSWHIIFFFVSPCLKNFHTTDFFAFDARVLPDPSLVNCKWSNFEWYRLWWNQWHWQTQYEDQFLCLFHVSIITVQQNSILHR